VIFDQPRDHYVIFNSWRFHHCVVPGFDVT